MLTAFRRGVEVLDCDVGVPESLASGGHVSLRKANSEERRAKSVFPLLAGASKGDWPQEAELRACRDQSDLLRIAQEEL